MACHAMSIRESNRSKRSFVRFCLENICKMGIMPFLPMAFTSLTNNEAGFLEKASCHSVNIPILNAILYGKLVKANF